MESASTLLKCAFVQILCAVFTPALQDIGQQCDLQLQGNIASTVSRSQRVPLSKQDKSYPIGPCGHCSNCSVCHHRCPLVVPKQPNKEPMPHPHCQHLHTPLPLWIIRPHHLCPGCNPQRAVSKPTASNRCPSQFSSHAYSHHGVHYADLANLVLQRQCCHG